MVRVLVVDDNARRYRRFVEAATAIGIDRGSIDFAPCANDARGKLEETLYDLLVLDILLPLWPDEAPSEQNSIDLLVELLESGDLKRPRQIVGITADDQIANKVAPIFKDRLWTIIPYAETHDNWLNQLINCVKYLQGGDRLNAAPQQRLDVAVICALHEPELTEVLKLPWGFGAAKPINNVTFVHEGHFFSDGRQYSVAALSAPRMGMISTALKAADVVNALRPRYLVMTGICAGVKGRTNLGDVVLADPSWDWQSGKRTRDKGNTQFAMAPHHLPVSSSVRAHVEQLRGDQDALRAIAKAWPGGTPGPLNIVIGPVASGSAVLADGQVILEIRKQHRELCGIEMEIYGLYAAAHNSSEPQPTAFALKSVCDFADPDKQDKYQEYAAYTSAQVMRLLFERFGRRLIDSR